MVPSSRITLQNQELLTSNMLVRCCFLPLLLHLSLTHTTKWLVFWIPLVLPYGCPYAICATLGFMYKLAHWFVVLVLLLGALRVENSPPFPSPPFALSPLTFSFFWKPHWQFIFRCNPCSMWVFLFSDLSLLLGNLTCLSDSGIVSGPPYHDYIQAFAMWAIEWGCKEKVNSSRTLFFFSDIKRRTHNGIRSSSGESVVIGSFASLSGYVFSLLSFFFIQRERSSNHKPRFDSKVLLLKIRFRRCVYFKNNAMVFHLLRKPLYRLLLYGSPSWCVDVGGNFLHSKTHELKWSIYIDFCGMQLWPWWVAPDISHTMFFGELNLF